ncbi:MAG: glycoside hydrolase family 2 TIM barrel-domain containing protein [Adlercreutzia sp.]
MDIKRVLASAPRDHDPGAARPLLTRWGEALDPETVRGEHPRPQFARDRFISLNGWWDYAFVPMGAHRTVRPPDAFDGRILVPFSPESLLSGVGRQLQPDELLWYVRRVPVPAMGEGERCLLHFEAVDFACACCVNGQVVGTHEGGYLPFSFDITEAIAAEVPCGAKDAEPDVGASEARVGNAATGVVGDAGGGAAGRAGPTAKERPTWSDAAARFVVACACAIRAMRAQAARQAAAQVGRYLVHGPKRHLAAGVDGGGARPPRAGPGAASRCRFVRSYRGCRRERGCGARARLRLRPDGPSGGRRRRSRRGGLGARGREPSEQAGPARRVRLRLDLGEVRRWSPDDPSCSTTSPCASAPTWCAYTAFRTVKVAPDGTGRFCFFLNGEPLLLRGVLDQGTGPNSIMTAPSDAALAFDIQAMKDAGFNMLRKHLKVEADRWYYHCDRLGMLVWQDMVSGGGAYDGWETSYKPTLWRGSWDRYEDTSPTHQRRLGAEDAAYQRQWLRECRGTVAHLRAHPSVVTWVLFNEGWGQFDTLACAEEIHLLDPTRPIDAVSGWYDQGAGDFQSVHNYFRPLAVTATGAT